MAESVDALVSNTSGATHPGSIPGLGTKAENFNFSAFFYSYILNSFFFKFAVCCWADYGWLWCLYMFNC